MRAISSPFLRRPPLLKFPPPEYRPDRLDQTVADAVEALVEVDALVAVADFQFEPVAGSEMEDVPAAREPRPATAVFAFVKGHWRTDGRVVFNHTPEQAVAVFGGQFAVLGHHH